MYWSITTKKFQYQINPFVASDVKFGNQDKHLCVRILTGYILKSLKKAAKNVDKSLIFSLRGTSLSKFSDYSGVCLRYSQIDLQSFIILQCREALFYSNNKNLKWFKALPIYFFLLLFCSLLFFPLAQEWKKRQIVLLWLILHRAKLSPQTQQGPVADICRYHRLLIFPEGILVSEDTSPLSCLRCSFG